MKQYGYKPYWFDGKNLKERTRGRLECELPFSCSHRTSPRCHIYSLSDHANWRDPVR